MRLRLIRHATLLVELAGRSVLVDPMLDPAGTARRAGHGQRRRDPLCELPEQAEVLVQRLDGDPRHPPARRHLDETAIDLLPKDVPVLCQPPTRACCATAGSRTCARSSGALALDGVAVARPTAATAPARSQRRSRRCPAS